MKVKKVQEELLCAICLDFLEDPKLLSCAHSFCRKCLQDLISLAPPLRLEEEKADEIHCPSCRDITSVPNGDVQELRTNFKLKSMVEIVSPEEKEHMREVIRIRKNPQMVDQWQLPVCSQHCRPQEYYCIDCNELLCRKCMIDRHRQHDFDEAEAVLWSRMSSMRSLVQPAWEAAAKAEDLKSEIATQSQSMVTNTESVTSSIKSFFEGARSLLNERESELLSTVDSYAGGRLAKLKGWVEVLEEDCTVIQDTIEHIESTMERHGDVSVITETHNIAETLNAHQQSILSISESISHQIRSGSTSLLTFDETQTLEVPINRLGTLREQVSLTSNTNGSSSRELLVGTSSNTQAQTTSNKPASDTECVELVIGEEESAHENVVAHSTDYQTGQPAKADSVTRPTLLHNSTSEHSLSRSLTPPSSPSKIGRHNTLPLKHDPKAKVKVCRKESAPILAIGSDERERSPLLISTIDQRVRGSSILGSLEELADNTPLREPVLIFPHFPSREYIQPCGVGITQGDSIIVSDIHSNSVKVLANSGRIVDTIGKEGKETGQFRKPSAIAIDVDHNIYVADSGNCRIQKFSVGTFISKWGHRTKESELGDVWGIAVAADGKVFASDWQNHCIHVFDRSGRHISRLGADFLKLPAGIAVNNMGQLLIADREYHCIWVLSPEGQMLKQIGTRGVRPGQLNYPYGVAVNQEGMVIITESGNCRVSIFSPQGEFITCFGGKGSEPGQFNWPKHVCVNSKGQIIVADEMNHRIQIFDPQSIFEDTESRLL